MEEANQRLTRARNLLIAGDLDADDYRTIKIETADQIDQLTSQNKSIINIDPLLNKALSNISQLDKLYEEASTEGKRKIIGSMFPKKLTFEKK